MPTLVGRADLLANLAGHLDRGASVLLVGPAGVGKSALIEAVSRPGVVVADPFEHVTARQAGRLRRLLDRGGSVLAASRTLDRAVLGKVRRIAWRFVILRVRPLAARDLRVILRRGLAQVGVPGEAAGERWLTEAAHEARGLPGYGVAIAGEAARHWLRAHQLPPPGFALAVALTDHRRSHPWESSRP